MPALYQAQDAVNCLQKQALTFMKSLAKPSPGIVSVARVVMIILGEKVSLTEANEKFWPKAQNAMMNPEKFMQRLKDFDGRNIEPAIIDNANKIINDPSQNYKVESMVAVSEAAAKLCAWSINILRYNKICKEVLPLQIAEKKATDELNQAMKELAKVKEEVRKLNEKVDGLKKQLSEAEEQKRLVEEDAQQCQNKLTAAEKLVNGLAV